MVDAEALPAKPRAMTPRLASAASSLLKPLIVRMITLSSPGGDPG